MARDETFRLRASNQKKKERFRSAMGALVALAAILTMLIVANAAVVFSVVSQQISTQVGDGGVLVQKDGGNDVRVAQSGQEIVLGLLPFLPLFAPAAALQAVPEFVVLGEGEDATGGPYHGLKIAEVTYSYPATMRLTLLSGGVLELVGPANASWIRPDGTVRSFCSACTPIQMKSLVNAPKLTQANAAFQAALDKLHARPDDPVARMCTNTTNLQLVSRIFKGGPAICHAAKEQHVKEQGRQLAYDAPAGLLEQDPGCGDEEEQLGSTTNIAVRRLTQMGAADRHELPEDFGNSICAGMGGCHPSHTTLELADGHRVRIDSVRTGDLVRTPAGVEPVTARMHADPHHHLDYFELATRSHTLHISEKHWLTINGREAPPTSAVVGDVLSTPHGEERIERVARRKQRGLYHIEVASGAYYADGVLVSTYVAECPRLVWRIFADGYAWLRYKAGLHIVPDGEGALPLFWSLALYERLGVPDAIVSHVLWPLTMASVLLTELANVLVWHAAALVPAATIGTLALRSSVAKHPGTA